jgi:hypothetical protein
MADSDDQDDYNSYYRYYYYATNFDPRPTHEWWYRQQSFCDPGFTAENIE